MTGEGIHVDASASVEDGATVGEGARIWGHSQVRVGATVGPGSIIGRNVFIDTGVVVGANCKVQNNALVYAPTTIEDGVFIGPAAVVTNDVNPRAVNPDGSLKAGSDWEAPGVHIGRGSAIGANATVVAGVRIGRWVLIAAGAVVVGDVANHALMAGVPARRIGWVGHHGVRLLPQPDETWVCPVDGTVYEVYEQGLRARA